MLDLRSLVTDLHRVGKSSALVFKKLGLATVHDLLFYFPRRYDEFKVETKIINLQKEQVVNIIGTIDLINNKKSRKRRLFISEAIVSDDSGSLKVIWFNQPFLIRSYQIGDQVSLAGKITENYGQLTMVSPIIEKVGPHELINTRGLVPNYHLSAGLTQKQLRFLIYSIINLADSYVDWLPNDIKKLLKLLDLKQALRQIHFPKNYSEIEAARRRLGFNELFLRQIKARLIRQALKGRRAQIIEFNQLETKKFVASLPFRLNDDQKKAAWIILRDLQEKVPMSRLLQGDVGSGKTVVAVIALLNTVLNGRQAIIMTPTTILAKQHYQSISDLLKNYNFKIALWLGGKKDQSAQNADIIIGTQALIQPQVNFPKLSLVVVDEQHRFGVSQRQKIIDLNNHNNSSPHFLSLSATPIPRSLALTLYGDLDISTIKQLPSGRRPVITKIITEAKRLAAYNFIRQEVKAGRQAFIICPLIEESSVLEIKSVKQEYEKLKIEIFPDLKVGLLHGKLKAKDQERVLADFLKNDIQILVSTAVIEVGIDIPNATLMIIEGADHFGLASLHQFRGRVGRSDQQSYCLLFTSKEETDNLQTIQRLTALTKYNDGFTLAKIDLRLRGAGELYGTGQSGWTDLQIASLFDYENIKLAQTAAEKIVSHDNNLNKHPLIKEALGEWENNNIHLE